MSEIEPSWDHERQDSRRQGGFKSLTLILIGALLAVVVGAAGLLIGLNISKPTPPAEHTVRAEPIKPAEPSATAESVAVTEESDALENDELAQRYGASVFRIETAGCQMEGWGTGWVLDDKHVVTNWHVVSNDPTPDVVSREGLRMAGTVIGGHLAPDVAVIRVEGTLPDPLPWAETDDLREGQEVVSLGYPAPAGDFSVTPSTIISFQRSGQTREAIRGDGALDRGNSGGPALTRDGEVAGVATVMVKEASQLQMVPLLYTTDALRDSVVQIIENPQDVEAECAPEFAMLPDDWAPDFDDWSNQGPDSYGDDTTLDQLYDACAGGDPTACDDLWFLAPYGSEYEAFATTCGGTASDPAYGSCQSRADWAAYNAELERQEQEAAAALAVLVTACQDGDMQACDDLRWQASYGSSEYAVADSCGGHYPEGWGSCVDREAEAATLQALLAQCESGDMQACDDLWWAADFNAPVWDIANDCGGLFPGGGGSCVYWQENP